MKPFIWVILLLGGVGFLFFLLHEPDKQTLIISPLTKLSLVLSYTPQSPTVEQIFSSDHSVIATLSASHMWKMIATGDVIPSRSVNYQSVKRNDFTWAFQNIASLLRSGDITVINLESPLIANCPTTMEGMIFCGDRRHIEGLLFAGVDVANFANNHMGNYGQKGIEETRVLLERNGMKVSGLDAPATVTVKGNQIAFLGFDDIGPNVPPIADTRQEVIKKAVFEAEKVSDLVVVSMNWGIEYTDQPSQRQKELAHLVVDSGADLVIGNHPHWIQPVEYYKGKLIIYAHGNTIFDQMWSEKTKIGVIGMYTFYDTTLIDVEFIPTYSKDYGRPMILESREKQNVIDEMIRISAVSSALL